MPENLDDRADGTTPGPPEEIDPFPDPERLEDLRRRITNPWSLRAFMLFKLPLALFAGLRVVDLDPEACRTTVPYGWRTTNPFRSTYFAAQSMAAELSTGALALLAVRSAPASVAMLITGLEASFGKKATDTTTFTCEDGPEIFDAVRRTLADGEPATTTVETVGRMPDGTEVARFRFTWSFKRRRTGS
ncbi:MAG: DUF4442 domain-containing protein [Thermoanaerobaculia bacterium]|nr:DUF4442 domain-containing protein [Thermoanaerobaculia bacterium]